MKRRDLVRSLGTAGYQKERDTGDHTIYIKPGYPPISVPRHNEINENTARAILKAAGLR